LNSEFDSSKLQVIQKITLLLSEQSIFYWFHFTDGKIDVQKTSDTASHETQQQHYIASRLYLETSLHFEDVSVSKNMFL